MFDKRLIMAGVTAVLIATLAACGGGEGDNGFDDGTDTVQATQPATGTDTEPTPDTVSGLRDTLRHLPTKTAKATRPHLVQKCTTASHQVRHTSTTGTGTRKKTRTWYTTEQSRTCKKVRSGTERYTRVVRAERWCVRLDNVDGDKTADDVWYQVTRSTYDEAVAADEHARLEFTPTASGC